VDNDHGRVETRAFQVADSKNVPGLERWPGCKSVGRVESTREYNGQTSYETRYFIFSFTPNAAKAAKGIRTYWHIENCLHWVLDVEFDEDRNRVRTEGSPQNLNIVRRTALNLLKSEQTLKTSLGKKRLKCAMSNDYLAKVLSGAI
jgi:predicted transposase YbfD/YdcC